MADAPDPRDPTDPAPAPGAQAALPPEAVRALAEAAQRRKVPAPSLPPEHGGRDGPEPVRYGDWEKKGLAIDF
jgi:hypothetical protein